MTTPEFSRLVSVARLTKPSVQRIEANAAERAALARRLELLSLDQLAGEVTLEREPGGGIRLDGALEAALVQRCVVTLGPAPAVVADRFTLIFRHGLDEAEADRLTFETEEDLVFETLEGDSIDIGEIVAQQLSLVIDPYPRAGDEAVETAPDIEPDIGERRPFDVLASLSRKA